MFEAQAYEFPFMVDLPKREKGRVSKALEVVREMADLQEKVGPIVPATLAAAALNISRQRFHQLVDEGKLKTFQFHGHHYVTEADLVEFAKVERRNGRPMKEPTMKECWHRAQQWIADERQAAHKK